MKGFTLIELLVVIGIMVILMGATLIAINPLRQFAMANNASRMSGVTTMMNAVYQNVVDNKGTFTCGAGSIPNTTTTIGSDTGQYDVCDCLVPTYLGTLPVDPQTGSFSSCNTYDTAFSIVNTLNRTTICAPDTQIPPEAADICITR